MRAPFEALDRSLEVAVDALLTAPEGRPLRLLRSLGAWYERYPRLTRVLVALVGVIPVVAGVLGLVVGVVQVRPGLVGQSALAAFEGAAAYLGYRLPVLLARRSV